MSLFRDLQAGGAYLGARVTGRRIPLFVQLMPTERCNLGCRYCYAQFGARVRSDFPLSPLLKVIDGLARLGCRNIMVAGGEPTLYSEIGTVVNRIADHKIRCSVNTNGVNVPSRIEELARADMLSISLDGPPEINDWYRGRGTYDQVIAAIRAARSRNIRVQLQFTLTRDLKKAFEHVNRIAEKSGCFIGINFLRPQEKIDGTVVKPAEASEEEVREFLGWLLRRRPRTLPYPPHLLKYVLRWPDSFGRHLIRESNDLKSFHPIPCQAGKYLMAIDNRGDIFPCTKLFYSEPLENCADGDIERAWRELKPIHCRACLDLGCNLMNDLLRFNPPAIWGLLNTWWLNTRRG